jgi:VIT1/CCC1 family predicted Fe2+/Mn2+ transporter
MAMGWYTEDQAAGWVASLVGAVVLLFIYGMIKGRSTGSRNAKGAVLLKQSAP